MVRCFTSYRAIKGDRLLIPVALSMEMAVDTIMKNTVLNQWEIELKYNPPTITSHRLRNTVELKYHPTKLSIETTSPVAATHVTKLEVGTSKTDPTDASNAQIASLHCVSKDTGNAEESNAWV